MNSIFPKFLAGDKTSNGYSIPHTVEEVNLEVLRIKSLAGKIFSKGKTRDLISGPKIDFLHVSTDI